MMRRLANDSLLISKIGLHFSDAMERLSGCGERRRLCVLLSTNVGHAVREWSTLCFVPQTMETFRKTYPSEFYKKFLEHAVRPDGRNLMKVRKTTVSVGSITSAEGSAFVKIGNTSVVAGVKAEIGAISEQHVEQIIVNVELTPLCSVRFKPGKPHEEAQVLCEYLNSIIRSTKLVDCSNLTVMKEYQWYLYVDLYCLNHDGNVFDASLIALIAALRNVRLPSVSQLETGEFVRGAESDPHTRLQLRFSPAPLSFGILEDYLLADPTAEEESLLTATLHLVYNENGQLCFAQKPGGVPIALDTLRQCQERTKKRVVEVKGLIDTALKKDEKQRTRQAAAATSERR